MRAIIRHGVSCFVAASVLAWLAGPGHAQFALYDDFSSGFIRPGLWEGISTEGTLSAPTAETLRLVENGSLHLSLVSWGENTSDTGTVLTRQGLNVRQLGIPGGSGFITGLKAKTTVLNAAAQDCTGNVAGASARAQLIGGFFNDGSGGVNNRTGDVLGILQLQKDADGVNRIVASVNRCPDNACSSSVPIVLAGNPVTFTGGWSLNAPMILKLVWDSTNGQFNFTATDPATLTQEFHSVVYLGTVAFDGPASVDFKSVRILNVAENCATGRKQTVMDVLVDNVMVQAAP